MLLCTLQPLCLVIPTRRTLFLFFSFIELFPCQVCTLILDIFILLNIYNNTIVQTDYRAHPHSQRLNSHQKKQLTAVPSQRLIGGQLQSSCHKRNDARNNRCDVLQMRIRNLAIITPPPRRLRQLTTSFDGIGG